MTADEWERIKAIFDTALQVPVAERSAWLDAACSGRPDFRQVVEQLLKNISEAGNFLEDLTGPRFRSPAFYVNQLVAGRFRVVRLIATGGMGEVYNVFDELLNKRVALKTIRSDLLASGEIYERFKREVWVTRDISHAGICRVFELIEHRDGEDQSAPATPCITMKLLDGRDLQAELRTRRPLPLHEALGIIRQICDALDALHGNEIIHRDLKPSNIMLLSGNREGVNVVLTDFGLARPLDQTTLNLNGAPKDQPGAPYFQAPELLKGEKASIASDIYALGLVIDELVTCSRAFTAESVHALYWQKLFEKPIPPSHRAPGLPAHWERVILRCLSTEPASRYKSAREVVDSLERPELTEPTLLPAAAETGRTSVSHSGARLRVIRSRGAVLSALTLCLLLIPWLASLTFAEGFGARAAPASIAVFPVKNETHRREYEHLGHGIRTELLRRLRGVRRLHVYELYEPSASGLRYSPEPIQFRLHTQLRTDPQTLRLAFQLSGYSDGKTIWSEEFLSPLSDPLGLESSAANGLIQALQNITAPRFAGLSTAVYRDAPLIGSVLRVFQGSFALPSAATGSSTAFQAYMRGRSLLEERTVKSALQAMLCFQDAVHIDPMFALAWSAMADAQRIEMEFDHGSREDLLQHAREFAERAVALNPDLPEAQATLGAVLQVAWEWQRSAQAYEKAVSLNPRYARGQRGYGGLLLQTGHTDQALERVRLALDLDPEDYGAHATFGFCLFQAGKPAEATEFLERILEAKDLISAHINLGLTYAYLTGQSQGQQRKDYLNKALRQADTLRERETQGADSSSREYQIKFADLIPALAWAYFGSPDEARPWLDRLEHGRRTGRTSSVSVSSVFAALGDVDRSLDLLEMASAYHERELTNLRVSPFFSSLRSHPRFQLLLKRIGLAS